MSSITTLRREAATCTACPLYRHATQTVFGEGDAHAAIVLVGEQPGNDEDLAGRPFVGPAGRLLDRALERAGLERSSLYVTNAVKHFKWSKDRGGGKRRIHEKPSASEVEACRPWLEQELWLIRPQVVVCLGATAARSVLARAVTIAASRGRPLTSPEGYRTLVTVHPSALLRIPDPGDREDAEERFVHQVPLRAIRRPVAASLDAFHLALHADRGTEAAEEEPAGFQGPPRSVQHGLEVRVIAGEMEDGVADDHIHAGILERHIFDRFDSKIRLRKRGREHPCEGANSVHSLPVRVRSVNFVPFPQEVDEVSTGTAPHVQYSHSG